MRAGDRTTRSFTAKGPPGSGASSGQGGTPQRVVSVDEKKGESAHGPQLLPGGRAVLFTLATGGGWNEAQIVVQLLDSGERKVVLRGRPRRTLRRDGTPGVRTQWDLARCPVRSWPARGHRWASASGRRGKRCGWIQREQRTSACRVMELWSMSGGSRQAPRTHAGVGQLAAGQSSLWRPLHELYESLGFPPMGDGWPWKSGKRSSALGLRSRAGYVDPADV